MPFSYVNVLVSSPEASRAFAVLEVSLKMCIRDSYYTIEKVDLSGDPAAVKAAGTLWNGVRRQMRMGAI